MNLQSQLTSLPLSKRLMELGVPQNAYFEWSFWTDHGAGGGSSECHEAHWEITDRDGGNIGGRLSAFSVAELGEWLPGTHHPFKMGKDRYIWLREKHDDPKSYAETEADARALTLIHLIEHGLIKV